KNLSGGVGVSNRVIDGRVGRGGDDAKNDTLVFLGRQFLGRYLWNRCKHEKRDERNAGPNNVNRRARIQCSIEVASVPVAKSTESTIASNVRRFRLKPKACIRNNAPISEIGIATIGTNTERKDPRNRKITTTTISSVSSKVFTTSWMASLM